MIVGWRSDSAPNLHRICTGSAPRLAPNRVRNELAKTAPDGRTGETAENDDMFIILIRRDRVSGHTNSIINRRRESIFQSNGQITSEEESKRTQTYNLIRRVLNPAPPAPDLPKD